MADSLLENLPNAPDTFRTEDVKNYYRNLNLRDGGFNFAPTTHQEICKILMELDTKKSVGLDNINATFLKDEYP